MNIVSFNAGNNVYDALESELRRKILNGTLRNGQSLYSESQLARNYRISRSSVRVALGNLERDGLVLRVRGSGTFVTPRMQWKEHCQASRPLGQQILFLSFSSSYSAETYSTHPMHEIICNGLSRILQTGNYALLMSHVGLNDELSISLEDKNIAGIIYSGRVTPEFYRKFLQNYTCIGLGTYNPVTQHCTVEMDHCGISYLAVAHLWETGCRNIGFISNECDETTPKLRYKGFLQAMKELKLKINPNFLIQWQRPRINGELKPEHGIPDYRRYLKPVFERNERPDAFVCIDDWRAFCVQKALNSMGLQVPSDVCLVGSCTTANARQHDFTSVCVRTEELYAQAARLLIDQLEQPESIRNISIKLYPELIIGNSTINRRKS